MSQIEYHVAFQHIIDRPGQLMGQDRQRLALAVFFLQAGQILLARRIVAEEQHRRFGEGPLEIRIADLRAGGAVALPRRFLGALDQAAVGHEILDPREAGDIMHLVEQHQAQNLADAGDGLEQVQGVWRRAAWPSARSSVRHRGAAGHSGQSGRGRLPYSCARRDRETARRPRRGCAL